MDVEQPTEFQLKHQQLLRDLKTTAEDLLSSDNANVWCVYGGLNRVHAILDRIFSHGYKTENDKTPYLKFIQGLDWCKPEHVEYDFSLDCVYENHIPQHLKGNEGAIWLFRCLERLELSEKLLWLLGARQHVRECYYPYAFFMDDDFTEGALICLTAIERNQGSLILEINPCLFAISASAKKSHKRTSSFPDSQIKKVNDESKKKTNTSLLPLPKFKIINKLKPWGSTPNLLKEGPLKPENNNPIPPNTPQKSREPTPISKTPITMEPKKKSSLKNPMACSSKSPKHVIIDNCDIIEYAEEFGSSQGSFNLDMEASTKSCPTEILSPRNIHSPRQSFVKRWNALDGEKVYKKSTFMDDGYMSILPKATGFFPKPVKGQTLMSFLSSTDFAKTNAELDRENAHFRISEAIISAMEHLKCQKDSKLSGEHEDDESSDAEEAYLKQRIRQRKRKNVYLKKKMASSSLLSDATTISPYSTSSSMYSDSSDSTENVDDIDLDNTTLVDMQSLSMSRSMSMASLFSEADIRRPRGAPDGASDVLSAEGVAISLISKFDEKQLPRASDLEWLVSENDTPQALLPLPKTWINDEKESKPEFQTLLRGTHDWAPLRPQIIFTLHPPLSRRILMEKQNYRCADCGDKVESKYASKFRYCEYYGRYFCPQCHKNQISLIPACVLQKWDFSLYPVSTFSYKLLEKMYLDPLFSVFELNKNVGRLSRNLTFCQKYRKGLFYLKDFIFSCKYAENIKITLQNELQTVFSDSSDPEMYSLSELVDIRSGNMNKKLFVLVDMCCKHTTICELCQARGFVCEICRSPDVIFPWQMRITTRCKKCKTVYHLKCWNENLCPCPKCQRLSSRRQSNASSTSSTSNIPKN